VKIPVAPHYDIDENAVVRLISTGEIVPEYINYRNKRAVRIRAKSHKENSCALDRLMLVTFKPPPPDKNPEWLSIRYVNGNMHDVSIDNLEWLDSWYHPQYIPGLNVPKDTWITVHGHPSLQLRLNGSDVLFRNTLTWAEVGTSSYRDNGYRYLVEPVTRRRLLVHRLVGLTLLVHPIDTDHLVVNHKDSNKRNNSYHNLEWTTYSENNFHAYSEGSRGDSVRKIRIKNIETGEELTVAGYQELARHVGDYPQGAHQAMERRKYEGRPYRGYWCKYEDDPRSWDELLKSGIKDQWRFPEKVAVRDMRSEEVKIYTSMADLKREEKIRDFMLFRLLNSPVMVPWRGRCFQAVVDNDCLKWPDYPEEILEVYDKTSVTDKPIAVTGPDMVTKLYPSATAWCMEDRKNRCDPAVLCRLLKREEERSGEDGILEYRDWAISHVNLGMYQ